MPCDPDRVGGTHTPGRDSTSATTTPASPISDVSAARSAGCTSGWESVPHQARGADAAVGDVGERRSQTSLLESNQHLEDVFMVYAPTTSPTSTRTSWTTRGPGCRVQKIWARSDGILYSLLGEAADEYGQAGAHCIPISHQRKRERRKRVGVPGGSSGRRAGAVR